MEIYYIKSWDEYIDKAFELTRSYGTRLLYRGQADTQWSLLPTVKRKPYNIPDRERRLVNDFYIEASRRIKEVPNNDTGWISLMQHYGLPTRLLDWSESPLVALYFAITEYNKYYDLDSAVWVLNPKRLNAIQGYGSYLYPMNYRTALKFIAPAFRKKAKEMNQILACRAIEYDLRMIAQQAAFTIHSTDTPLEKIGNADEFLCKLIIHKSVKTKFAKQLDILGYNLKNIFPDMEHISKELKDKYI